jgi:hypothetical protein
MLSREDRAQTTARQCALQPPPHACRAVPGLTFLLTDPSPLRAVEKGLGLRTNFGVGFVGLTKT